MPDTLDQDKRFQKLFLFADSCVQKLKEKLNEYYNEHIGAAEFNERQTVKKVRELMEPAGSAVGGLITKGVAYAAVGTEGAKAAGPIGDSGGKIIISQIAEKINSISKRRHDKKTEKLMPFINLFNGNYYIMGYEKDDCRFKSEYNFTEELCKGLCNIMYSLKDQIYN
ncbi:hypothetical protein [Wolbachia endosymbiont of Pentidionis agamae]|uniref:hypothetical protein n=1 Tax=Wolbachia endosymbiont of Pentidionis agamae TaxID=3110435 RepID=UPI002FD78EFF